MYRFCFTLKQREVSVLFQPYETVAGYASDEFIERKSRFIGHIAPVKDEAEALDFLSRIRTEHREATHNVFAYILRESGIKRMSDDGEPQGTGGVPVLEVLEREGLTDVAVVVTRYFGGILLGAGGLVRAYSHGAKLAVDAAVRRHMNPCSILELHFGYDWYGKISYLLPRYNAQTIESDFGAQVRLRIMITSDKAPAFQKEITELTAASVMPQLVEEVCADLE
ncbi:MAG: YigZ family protein [Oscillospiraceae bacterium]|nr:YigZ family protein [Oscillospiraceae bacterium]